MPIVDVLVPQMGEGLQEVLVVEFLKKPGNTVTRDEPFYSMETDKATMEVESPHEGTLVEWLVAEGDTLAIGSPVCRMEIQNPPPAPPVSQGRGSEERAGWVPPRTRAYAKEKGLGEEALLALAAKNPKLMPADIDAYLAIPPSLAGGGQGGGDAFVERLLSAQDKILLQRLKRSAEQVIPATAKRHLAWDGIRAFAAEKKRVLPELAPSAFNVVAWAISQAAAEHPRFRSTLLREEAVREYDHLNLGIAVARDNGELVVAVVPDADTLDFESFVRVSKERIALARGGKDQADEATQFLVSYMGPYEIIDAIPVLVAPAAAVLFIGSAFPLEGKQVVTLALTFDHRLMHGVEAAEFLRTIARKVDALGEN